MPIQVLAIYDPAYEHPWLIGTPLLALQPQAGYEIYDLRGPSDVFLLF